MKKFLEDILPRNSFFDDFEVTHNFPQIGLRTMLLNARQLDLKNGSQPMILLAIEDVTELRRAEVSIARLAAIVASSEDAIVSKDLQGTILSWNQGAQRIFGYTAQEAVGKPITMLISPDLIEEESRILEKIRRGDSIEHYETVRRRKDGRMIEVSLTISPIKDFAGRIVGASKIARDITTRKQAMRALMLSHKEQAERTEELGRFNDAAVGRELRMIELKKEINELCQRNGEPARYALEFEREEGEVDA